MRTYTKKRRLAGFTLIEVMVVVAVIGILAAVAYPSYASYIVKSNRRAAQSFMLEVSSRQQRYLLDARAYAADMTALNMTAPADVSNNYTITTTPSAGPPPGFEVVATARGSQATRDSGCHKLKVNQAGAKTAEDAGGTATTKCW